MALIAGVAIILAILALPAYGYYGSFVAPPRVVAAKVRDTTFTMGDLVKRIRIQQSATRYFGSNLDLGVAPFETLFTMTESELIEQEAPRIGINVHEAEVTAAINARFAPYVPPGQEVSPGQLETEAKERYRDFLTSTRLGQGEYRKIVRESVYREKLRIELAKRVPTTEESVEVFWTLVPLPRGNDPSQQRIDPREIQQKIEKQGFEAAIDQLGSAGSGFADGKGYVGWVPKGAFPSLDPLLFGKGDTKALELNKVSDPISTSDGWYIVKVAKGPEAHEVSEQMRSKLESEVLNIWVRERWDEGTKNGWLSVNFNSDLYSWVVKQVRASAPRGVTPTPAGS